MSDTGQESDTDQEFTGVSVTILKEQKEYLDKFFINRSKFIRELLKKAINKHKKGNTQARIFFNWFCKNEQYMEGDKDA